MRFLSLLIISLLLSTAGAGQQFLAKHFDLEDGMPHATVYRIFQDKKGFLWFCTDAGLCSFDGLSFTDRISIDDSFLYSSPMSVSEDAQGNKIVCSYYDGIFIVSDSLTTHYTPACSDPPKFYFYAASENGIIWLAGKKAGDFLYKAKNGTLTKCDLDDSAGKSIAIKKVLRSNGRILITTDHGLYTIHNEEVVPYLHDLVPDDVMDLRVNKHGQYVVALKDRIVVADSMHIITRYELDGTYNDISIACDGRDNIWVLIYGQKMLLLKNGNSTDISNYMPTQNLYINYITEDAEGNIWFATYNEGVYMIPSTDILSYSLNNKRANSHCHSIKPMDSSNMLVGSIGNVSIFSGGEMRSLHVASLAHDEFVYTAIKIGGYIYIGTPNKLIRKSVHAPFREETIDLGSRSGAVAVYQDRKGRVWIGGFAYVYIMDNGRPVKQTGDSLLLNKRFNDILEDSRGNMWYATNMGLIVNDGKTCRWAVEFRKKAYGFVSALMEDSRGRVWIAFNGGVICVENGKARTYEKRDGLLSAKCLSICEDERHVIWIGTPKGLNYLDPVSGQIKAYYDGINRKEVLSIHAVDNKVFVGTTDNLLSMNADLPHGDAAPPPVYINSVRTSKHTINAPLHLSLPYNENKAIIDFIAISFRHPTEIEYRYKVSGLDNNWRVTTNHSIELAALPSGNYDFVLSARTRDGQWGKEISLPISVSTPFWKNYSFILLAVGGLAYAIYILARRQTERREAKKREKLLLLNKIAYLRQQALSALINPHFIFNCMNSIQHFLNRKDHERANSYLADFAGLIRLTMEHAQEMFIDLNSEINRLQLYLSLEQLRFGDGLTFSFTVDKNIDIREVMIPNMIVQPYIENAIWHGIMPNEGKGIIKVSFTMHGNGELRITVEDNGIGIQQSKKMADADNKKHYGMGLTEERLQLLRQISGQTYNINVDELYGTDGACTGTRVVITVPSLSPTFSLRAAGDI